ncbi:hypothetical protein IV203_020696 [Nitzschia inconspicua]|uniref:Uncharacterized protein n=1 Tax=Nitzschia inconspicua TaxID=303405 RepID=A0A9K3P8Z4_9STRA|nr:hypothetical protein IV203_021614 [Nitzschia inconspicua]KAG7342752.1 hypothetical protein IV203_020696 [Nitzschia inconspicua]
MASNPTNAAGDLPLNDDLTGVVTIKKGSIHDNPGEAQAKRCPSGWSKITQREVDEWQQDAGKTPQESKVFEFFVYQPRDHRPNGRQIPHAPASRSVVEARNRLLAHHQRQNNTRLGPIQLHHLATVNARRPYGSDLIFPNDATNRQAEALDRALEECKAEDEIASAQRNAPYQPILIKFNGSSPMEVQVNVQSLRDALGLPPHNMLHNGIFHE